MASFQAYLLDFLIRAQIKRKMKGLRDIARVRHLLEAGKLPVPKNVTFREETIGGVPGEWVEAQNSTTKSTLLYLHGGGYFACSPRTHRPITAAFAKLGFAVFVPDYRLAPENPFPAAIDDAEAVWNGLVERGHAPASLVVAGDLAGGGLALALMLTLRDKGQALPAAAALFSPWTDLAATGELVVSNASREAMFWAPGLVEGGATYLNGADPKTPLASPLYADLAGLPPVLIHAGDREVLRDDSTRLAKRARAAGVHVDLKIWPVVPHVWQLAQFVPEARSSLSLAAKFLHSMTVA